MAPNLPATGAGAVKENRLLLFFIPANNLNLKKPPFPLNRPALLFAGWMFLFVALCFQPLSALAQKHPPGFERGVQAFQKKDYQTARKIFIRVIRRDASHAPSHYYLGLTYNYLNQSGEAVKAFKKAALLDPDLPGIHLSLGIAYYKTRSYYPAHRELETAIQKDPRDGSAWYFLGLTRQKLNQYNASIEMFEKAARFDPDLEQSSRYHIGRAYYQTRRTAKARQAFNQAIALDPKSDTAGQARQLLRQMRQGHPLQKDYSFTAGVGFIYDDNLSSRSQDLISDVSDIAVAFELGGKYVFRNRGPYSAEASYNFFQSLYSEEDQFNLQTHDIALSASRDFQRWDWEAGYQLNYSRLGGSSFLDMNRLYLEAGREWNPKWYTRPSYALLFKNFHQDFNDPRDAMTHSAGFDQFLFFDNQKSHGRFAYRFIYEDTSGDPFDYLGHRFSLAAQVPTSYEGKLSGSYRFLYKDFQNVTPSIGAERLDKRHTFQINWTTVYQKMVQFKFDLQHIRSDSNLPAVDYTENILSVGAKITF